MDRTSTSQQAEFAARLARIRARGGVQSPVHGVIEQPPEQELPVPQGKTRKPNAEKPVSVLPGWRERTGYPLGILFAFLLGGLAVCLSRYARFHIAGGSLAGEDPTITMAIDATLAMGIGFVFRMFLRNGDAEQIAAKGIGVAAMIAVMHNFVHAAPAPFEALFSPEWVEEVVTNTEPRSILFQGVSFVIGETEDQAPAMPTVLRLD